MDVKLFVAILWVLWCSINLRADNIDPDKNGWQYAYGENVGWVNFEPGKGPGVQVSTTAIKGYAWAENIGWINLSPIAHAGVANDSSGNLSGYAWGENVGWINFSPDSPAGSDDYGVKIDSEGRFSGWAWGENIGWINFGLVESRVVACKVTLEDLTALAIRWLGDGTGNPADLHPDDEVDLQDFSILASYWLDYCPDNWPFR